VRGEKKTFWQPVQTPRFPMSPAARIIRPNSRPLVPPSPLAGETICNHAVSRRHPEHCYRHIIRNAAAQLRHQTAQFQYATARKRHNAQQKRHITDHNQHDYRTIFLNRYVTRVQGPLKGPLKRILRPILGFKICPQTVKKLAWQVVNPPVLKENLGEFSSGYLIHPPPLRKGGDSFPVYAHLAGLKSGRNQVLK
jgi:hypothetical protein